MVVWVLVLCNLLTVHQCFGETYYLHGWSEEWKEVDGLCRVMRRIRPGVLANQSHMEWGGETEPCPGQWLVSTGMDMAPPHLLITWLWLANPPGLILLLILYKPSTSLHISFECRTICTHSTRLNPSLMR
jgi:hypothetical protein